MSMGAMNDDGGWARKDFDETVDCWLWAHPDGGEPEEMRAYIAQFHPGGVPAEWLAEAIPIGNPHHAQGAGQATSATIPTGQTDMTNISETYKSTHMKGADFGDEPEEYTLSHTQVETIFGKRTDVVYFNEREDGLKMTGTGVHFCAKVLGNLTENWPLNSIFVVVKVKYDINGKETYGLKVIECNRPAYESGAAPATVVQPNWAATLDDDIPI